MIQALLAKYAIVLIAIAGIVGYHYYSKHQAFNDGKAECRAEWEEAYRKDGDHAKLLEYQRQNENLALKNQYELHDSEQLRRLAEYAKTVTIDLSAANAAVSRLRGQQTTRKNSCSGGRADQTTSAGAPDSGSGKTLSDSDLATSLKALEILVEEYVKPNFEVVP